MSSAKNELCFKVALFLVQGFLLVSGSNFTQHDEFPRETVRDGKGYKLCVLPHPPQNGDYKVFDYHGPTTPGSLVPSSTVLQYECHGGFHVFVYSVAICVAGKWDTTFQKCQRKDTCILPARPENGRYRLTNANSSLAEGSEVSNWSMLLFKCDASFDLLGSKITICRNGVWTGQIPTCEKSTRCVVPDAPRRGKYAILSSLKVPEPGSIVDEREILQYECLEARNMRYAFVVICLQGQWQPQVPMCTVATPCILPGYPDNGKYLIDQDTGSTPGAEVPSSSVLTYICNPLYDLVGSKTIICKNGSWSSEEPQCQKNFRCRVPEPPMIGNYSILSSHLVPVPGSMLDERRALQYSCPGFRNQIIICSNGEWVPRVPDCLEVYTSCDDIPTNISGLYIIQPIRDGETFVAYCDLTHTEQKWTVIQQRTSGNIDFFRNYHSYAGGFGNPAGNHWLGLEHIHQITKDGNHELYVELEGHDNTKAYARYKNFTVGSSTTGYKLVISGFSGNAGDSLTYAGNGGYSSSNGMKFSAYDKDRDSFVVGNNAMAHRGGWWYAHVSKSNLNGRYYNTSKDACDSMYWYFLYKSCSALRSSRMLIRRK